VRLRSITLENVRRFTEPVTVGPIGDGVTLLCEPNEAGKSTLFDALHAVFFLPHTSGKAEIKALRPHSGGKVSVDCEIELEGARWRIRKEWLSGPAARVWRDGVLVHQGDAAESWVAGLVSGEAGGPGGLLWVRQGRVSLATENRTEAGQELAKRRDVLTAISGAMDEVTGGERMDRAIMAVSAELSKLQTATGRPKAGGRWAEAEAAVAELAAEKAALSRTVEDLRTDLEARRKLRAELAEIDDEALALKRREALREAEAALREAEGQQRELAAAGSEARLARQMAKSAAEEVQRNASLRAEAKQAATLHEAAMAAHRTAEEKKATADAAHRAAHNALGSAKAALMAAQATLRKIDQREAAERAKEQRVRLAERVAKAEAAEKRRIAQQAHARKGPDAATVDRIVARARDVETRRSLRNAAAPRVTAHYIADAEPVRMAGQPLEEGEERAVPENGLIELPGIGTLRIAGAEAQSERTLADGEAQLREALAEGGWADLAALHEAARLRAEALRASELAEQLRDTLAPDGLDALRAEAAALPEDGPEEAADLPDRAAAEHALDGAQAALYEAEAAAGKAAERAQAAALTAAKGEAQAEASRTRRENAARALTALPTEDAAESARRIAKLEASADAAETRLAALAAGTPDIAKLRAHHARLKGTVEAAASRVAEISAEVGKLDGRIEARGEAGVEELLRDVSESHEAALATLDRAIFEKKALTRLRDALETAQKAARETYFAPVVEELRPLLADLWEDAELVWSDDTLLPSSLVRRGTEEPIDVLSGGTQEQIAFLVRLAFARLLARSGRHAPLILDDALVYSDDDRIEKLFDALHGAAGDLQIIVLSCRQRAFRDLGAPALSFRHANGA